MPCNAPQPALAALLGATLLPAAALAAPAGSPVIYSFNYMSDGPAAAGRPSSAMATAPCSAPPAAVATAPGAAAQGTVYKLTPPLLPHGMLFRADPAHLPRQQHGRHAPHRRPAAGPRRRAVRHHRTRRRQRQRHRLQPRPAHPRLRRRLDRGPSCTPSPPPNGGFPIGGVIADPAGALYGVAYGGAFNEGIVYRLVPPAPGQTQWTEQTLHSFNYATGDGQYPSAPLVRDPAGNLYGVTNFGGGRCNCGVAYELSPPSAGQTVWTETILHEFVPGADSYPAAGLVIDAAGTLYGTAAAGGIQVGSDHSGGLVYRLRPPARPGAAWSYAPIFLFNATDGGLPQARLTLTPLRGSLRHHRLWRRRIRRLPRWLRHHLQADPSGRWQPQLDRNLRRPARPLRRPRPEGRHPDRPRPGPLQPPPPKPASKARAQSCASPPTCCKASAPNPSAPSRRRRTVPRLQPLPQRPAAARPRAAAARSDRASPASPWASPPAARREYRPACAW